MILHPLIANTKQCIWCHPAVLDFVQSTKCLGQIIVNLRELDDIKHPLGVMTLGPETSAIQQPPVLV